MSGPTFSGLTVLTPSVPRWHVATVAFDLSGSYSDLFGIGPGDEIFVDALVTGPRGELYRQPCVPWQEYTVTGHASGHGEQKATSGSRHWRLNFAPTYEGHWTATITATTAGGATTSSTFSFTCTTQVSSLSAWRIVNGTFTYSDGKWFAPIGHNYGFNDRDYHLDLSAGANDFIDRMGATGQNTTRVWMHPHYRTEIDAWSDTAGMYGGFDNDYSGIRGDINLRAAWDMAYLLDRAVQNDVSVILVMQAHGAFSTTSDSIWSENPYNSANGGPLSSPEQFFSNSAMLQYQKRKYRYAQGAFPHPSVGLVEFGNEMGSIGTSSTTSYASASTLAAWGDFLTRIGQYRRSIDYLGRKTSVSQMWEPQAWNQALSASSHFDTIMRNPEVDVPQFHRYHDDVGSAGGDRGTERQIALDGLRRYGKLIIQGEGGALRSPSAPEPQFDPTSSSLGDEKISHLLEGTHAHNLAWESLMTPGCRWGGLWWWGSYLRDNAGQNRSSGTRHGIGWSFPLDNVIYPPMAAFVQAEDLSSWNPRAVDLLIDTPASMDGWGQGNDNRGWFWLRDTLNVYGSADLPGDMAGRTVAGDVTIHGLVDGSYAIEMWATRGTGGLVVDAEFTGGDPTNTTDSASAINSFIAANNGKVIGFPASAAYRIDASVSFIGWSGTVLWRGTTLHPRYDDSTKFGTLVMRHCSHVTMWDFGGSGIDVTADATTSAIVTAAGVTGNIREQEHAIELYGGNHLSFINPTTKHFWGDGFWLVRDTLGGGDGSSPSNIIIWNHTVDQVGRNGISPISSGGVNYYLNAVQTNVGFCGFDIEPNVSADVAGSWIINGCSFASYDLLHNNTFNGWGSGKAISSVMQSTGVVRPLLDARNNIIAKPSTSSTIFDIRNTTAIVAHNNVSDVAGNALMTVSNGTIKWGTNTRINPSPSQAYTAPPPLTLPRLPTGTNGFLGSILASSSGGALTFTSPTIDRDMAFKVHSTTIVTPPPPPPPPPPPVIPPPPGPLPPPPRAGVEGSPVPSEIVIAYDGVDITRYVIYQDCSFESAIQATPGVFSVTLKDTARALGPFVTGRELTVDIDGYRMYGGYVLQVRRGNFFPAVRTDDLSRVYSRQFKLTGMDYNFRMDKLILRDINRPIQQIANVVPGTYDGAIIRSFFPQVFDLPPGFDFSTMVQDVHLYPSAWAWQPQGSSMRDQLTDLGNFGAFFFFDGYKRLHFEPVQSLVPSWGFSDVPDGLGTIGFREGSTTEDATGQIDDAFVWGGGALSGNGVGGLVFARAQDAPTIAEHGRWQIAENHVGDQNYFSTQAVQARANTIISGTAEGTTLAGSKGLLLPEKQYALTWFSHDVPKDIDGNRLHLLPGAITRLDLWTFSTDGGVTPFTLNLPLKQVKVTFPILQDGTGRPYVRFDGFFGIQQNDPYWLWDYLLKQSKARASTIFKPITTAGTGTVDRPPSGTFYTGLPVESPDGSLLIFHFPFPYMGGTAAIYLNGLLQRPTIDFTESDPATGEFTMSSAPASADSMLVQCRTA